MNDTPDPTSTAWRDVLVNAGIAADIDTDVRGTPGMIRVLHYPQIPASTAFAVAASSFEDAQRTEALLVAYDLFQFDHSYKPDYASLTVIQVADVDGDWCDVDTDAGETADDIYHPFMVGTKVRTVSDYRPAYLAGRTGVVCSS